MSRLARQSFLGVKSEAILQASRIGLVGLGGGGSHICQQMAHIGIGDYILVDPDIIDHTNTNRLVGGTLSDVENQMPKVAIAERIIRGIQPEAKVTSIQDTWKS